MGPLMSYHDFCSQIEKAKPETHHLDQIICRFIIGLTKKVVFANSLGIVFQTVMKNDSLSLITAWCALLAFTFQLYFDFSGYCDIAIALGKSLGFELSENFNLPYTAISIKDFWKRWHITLSQWFKNYVYIPLKGSRCSKRRAILNTSVVWILTGLWHGANWNYLLWGIYYFILLMLERYVFDEQLNKLSKRVRQGITFILVMFGWALFAFEDMGVLKEFILSLFGFNGFMDSMSLWIIKNYFILFVLSFVISWGILKKKDKYSVISMILLFLVDIAYMMNSTYQPFFYIQF